MQLSRRIIVTDKGPALTGNMWQTRLYLDKKKLYTILKVILDKRLSALNFQLFHVQEMAWMEGASIKVTRMEVALMEVASMDPA